MTILLVDAGNSRLKWSELGAAGEISVQQAQAYGDRPTLAVFTDLLDAYPRLKYVTIVHVLTHLFEQTVEETCRERGIGLHIVRSVKSAYGIISGYQEPANLGADRFVGLVAAHHMAGRKACIVVDCGTAVTIDAVEKDGRHLGGMILPGLQLSADALIARAQNRLSLSFEHPTIFADGTARAIGGGCLFGLIGAIEGICTRMQHAMSTPPTRVMTGGDAEHLRPWLSADCIVQPDLLMRGLHYITEQQTCIHS